MTAHDEQDAGAPARPVPMLTEVIAVSAQADEAPPSSETDEAADEAADALAEQTALRALQALTPALDVRISEAIARVLHEQLLGLGARVQREVAAVVRQAVAEALQPENDLPENTYPEHAPSAARRIVSPAPDEAGNK